MVDISTNADKSAVIQEPQWCQIMSDCPSNESIVRSSIQLSLDSIMCYYADIFHINISYDRVGLYRIVASELSEMANHRWSWRYILSIRNGTMSPGGLIADTITRLHTRILLPPPVPRPPRIAVPKGDAKKAIESLFGERGLDPEVRNEFVQLVKRL